MNTKCISKFNKPFQTKINVCKEIDRSILTLESESWVLTEKKKQNSKIQDDEVKYFRRIKEITK